MRDSLCTNLPLPQVFPCGQEILKQASTPGPSHENELGKDLDSAGSWEERLSQQYLDRKARKTDLDCHTLRESNELAEFMYKNGQAGRTTAMARKGMNSSEESSAGGRPIQIRLLDDQRFLRKTLKHTMRWPLMQSTMGKKT